MTGITDRMQKVRFAESHAPIQEKRVVGSRRLLCHSLTRRVSQPVPRTNNICIERITRIQADMPGFWFRRGDLDRSRSRFDISCGRTFFRLGNNKVDGDLRIEGFDQ